MKVHDWNMQPVRKTRREKPQPGKEDLQVHTIVATKNHKRVMLHRVERTLPNGKKEVFIIKASPKEMGIDH